MCHNSSINAFFAHSYRFSLVVLKIFLCSITLFNLRFNIVFNSSFNFNFNFLCFLKLFHSKF